MTNATETTTTPCPTWCGGRHDGLDRDVSPRYHELKVAENVAGLGLDLTAEDVSNEDGTLSRSTYLSLFTDDENERLTATEARDLAALLLLGADRLDETSGATS